MSTVTVGETTATVAAYRTAQQDVAVVANSMRDKAVDDWQVKVAEAGGPIGVYFDKSKAWEYWVDYQDVVKSFVELSCCNSGRSRDIERVRGFVVQPYLAKPPFDDIWTALSCGPHEGCQASSDFLAAYVWLAGEVESAADDIPSNPGAKRGCRLQSWS